MILEDLNFLILAIFAPTLILVGLLGFIIPPHKSPTSGAPPYNIFHIVFGALGVIIVMSGRPTAVRVFNVGFGLIDLYQAAASYLGLFPRRLFKWTRADDILHIAIGLALVLIGVSSR